MHDKTFVLPIIDELVEIIKKQPKKIIIKIGEFTNLAEDTILHTLKTEIPKIYELDIDFEYFKGKIKCYECDYTGDAGKIYADRHSHMEVIVGCPDCDSIRTVKLSGRNLLIDFY